VKTIQSAIATAAIKIKADPGLATEVEKLRPMLERQIRTLERQLEKRQWDGQEERDVEGLGGHLSTMMESEDPAEIAEALAYIVNPYNPGRPVEMNLYQYLTYGPLAKRLTALVDKYKE
jgi:hypothetical protein